MSSTTHTDQAATDHDTTHAVPAAPESTDTTARTETEDKLWEALHANPNSTAADLSTDAGIGRSTAAKILPRWANDGADLWSITDPDAPSVTLEVADTEHADTTPPTPAPREPTPTSPSPSRRVHQLGADGGGAGSGEKRRG